MINDMPEITIERMPKTTEHYLPLVFLQYSIYKTVKLDVIKENRPAGSPAGLFGSGNASHGETHFSVLPALAGGRVHKAVEVGILGDHVGEWHQDAAHAQQTVARLRVGDIAKLGIGYV